LRFALEKPRRCFASLSFSAPSRFRSAAGFSVLGEAQQPGEAQHCQRAANEGGGV
jgi:hypothetical protein